MGKKRTLLNCLWECQLVLWRRVWRFLKKLKIELPYDPEIPLMGAYSEKTKTLFWKDTCTLCSQQHYVTVAKTQKPLRRPSADGWIKQMWLLLLLSRFSRVRLCATPEMAAHQAPPSLGFSRQEHWSGLPFPSPMHESEKWKWSHSTVSTSERPHRLQPTRLFRPWDFPGKSTGVGCHCLRQVT